MYIILNKIQVEQFYANKLNCDSGSQYSNKLIH